jgi:SAM-dependent methyltransferase
LYECRNCGYAAIVPFPDPALLPSLYDQAFFETAQQALPLDESGAIGPEAERSPIYRNACGRVAKLLEFRRDGRLLDIGSGKGVFVKVALQYYAAQGVDASPCAVAWGRQHGLPLVCGTFLETDLGDSKFEIVTMWDSLGSMPGPLDVFRRVCDLLAPGGLFALTTPDGGALSSRLLGRYWPMMVPPINVAFHTRRSLECLGERTGLRLIDFRHEGKWIDLGFMAFKLKRQFGFGHGAWRSGKRSTGRNAGWRARSHPVYLNLFDIATAILRRDSRG